MMLNWDLSFPLWVNKPWVRTSFTLFNVLIQHLFSSKDSILKHLYTQSHTDTKILISMHKHTNIDKVVAIKQKLDTFLLVFSIEKTAANVLLDGAPSFGRSNVRSCSTYTLFVILFYYISLCHHQDSTFEILLY